MTCVQQTKATQLSFIRMFLEDTKPCCIPDFDIVYNGVIMTTYINKWLKRCKPGDSTLVALINEFPIIREFLNATSNAVDMQRKVLYTGFKAQAKKEILELQMQEQSLRKAIAYARARLANPDNIPILVQLEDST